MVVKNNYIHCRFPDVSNAILQQISMGCMPVFNGPHRVFALERRLG